MTRGRLLLRNLCYHWRANSAVFLGVLVGAAVLTGALLVGDSLRGSLNDLALRRLGWVDQALVSGRFVREELAAQLAMDHAAGRVCPALLLQGTLRPLSGAPDSRDATPAGPLVGRIAILGVDDRFWPEDEVPVGRAFWRPAAGADPDESGVVLSAALAAELKVQPGQTVALHLQKRSDVPRETLLGKRDAADVVAELRLRVRAVLSDDSLGSRFSLNPSPAAPRNAFVPLRTLQSDLWPEKAGSRTAPELRVNALLAQGGDTDQLQTALAGHLQLTDWQLELLQHKDRGYLSLQSRQMFLEPAIAEAAQAAAEQAGLLAAPTLVYLANSIADETQEIRAISAALGPDPLTALRLAAENRIPYSVVAALDPALKPPLGPFLPPGAHDLKDDEIVLADWKESPLQAQPGDRITLTYFPPEEEGTFQEKTATFRLKGKVPLKDVTADPGLTPAFPGITDKLSITDWQPPFPYHNKRIKPRDERYWKEYRTTPKAYVTLAAGQKLWGSRFGSLTSMRLAPVRGHDLAAAAKTFRRELRAQLRPARGGLEFQPVRARALEASQHGTDFSVLFLGFSGFLIVAALLLVGLLFRLNIDRRGSEIGLLLAAGYRRSAVRSLLIAEGGLLAVGGALLGLAGAVLYARLLLSLLATLPVGLERSLLQFHWTYQSFVIGYVVAVVVSVLTIVWAVRVLGHVSPSALLAGQTAAQDVDSLRRPARWSRWVAVGAAVAASACLVYGVYARDPEMKASSFFGSGALLLTAGLAAVWAWMRGSRHARVAGHGPLALARLGVRNAARHPVRSLLTAGLLASATFVVVAVASFHRDPDKNYLDKSSGSGGFALLGEADLPIYQDFNTDKGRDELNFPDRARGELKGVSFYGLRVRAGDDASCLNLYQPTRPRLFGVPHALIERGGFQFQDSLAHSPEERQDPWRLLEEQQSDGAIPVFGEANTVQWMLKSKLGGELTIPNDRGEPVKLRIVGLLQDSVFQSGLLLSEANFLKLYPTHEGYNFFLIDVQPPAESEQVKNVLADALAERGFEVTSSASRLATYLAVENTYLSTFQALGGLGLLLGALGLAIVLLRSVWERRGELALLRALGFRHQALGWLVLAENAFLLVLGLGVGVVAALLAVAPPLFAGTGEVPWLRLLVLLALVLVVGLAAGAAAMAAALRAPLLPALRHE
ncbi:MAG TPA: FtsX-like permease family protein [Gemmataceae bacterium]|nr:FtsX-like permease family protein [Gemmataceae bacterium]